MGECGLNSPFRLRIADQLFSESGVGDFGGTGILTFIHDHTCGAICRGVGFSDLDSIDDGEGEELTDDGGETTD
jgi:hypothetical protein